MGDIAKSEKGRSPFSPGQPVPPEMFVGRDEQIARMLRSVKQVSLRKQQNLFVTGEYGIGKSSLVTLVRVLGERQHRIFGCHVFLYGVTTVEEMVQHVVRRLVEQAYRNRALERIRALVGRYVESVELFGVRVNLHALEADAADIAADFLPFLRRVWRALGDEFQGVALFLDDLNGIARSPRFASMLKSLVDEIAAGGEELPLLLGLAGVPERRNEIVGNQPSVARIFDVVEINPLTDSEVEQFFARAFASAGITLHPECMKTLVHFSGGLPKLMHELGEAAFWADRDGVLQPPDVLEGLMLAADAVGRKYFDPVRAALRSSDYHSILAKLGVLGFDLKFRRDDLARGLSPGEARKLDNFLQRMKRLHALAPGDVRGEWVFPNRLVRLYLLMESRTKAPPGT